jgi:hypothetical protein
VREGARARQLDGQVGDDAAGAIRQHDHAIGEEDRLLDRVGDENDRRRRARGDGQELQVEALPRELVEGAERLVEEQDAWLERQRPRQRSALAHAPGKLARDLLRGLFQPDRPQERLDHLPALLQRGTRELERVGDVGLRGAPRKESWLLEHEPDSGIRAVDGAPIEGRLAALGGQQPGDDAQERRLAAPVRSDQGDQLTGFDHEVDAIERDQPLAPVGRERHGDVTELDPSRLPGRRLPHAAPTGLAGAASSRPRITGEIAGCSPTYASKTRS